MNRLEKLVLIKLATESNNKLYEHMKGKSLKKKIFSPFLSKWIKKIAKKYPELNKYDPYVVERAAKMLYSSHYIQSEKAGTVLLEMLKSKNPLTTMEAMFREDTLHRREVEKEYARQSGLTSVGQGIGLTGATLVGLLESRAGK